MTAMKISFVNATATLSLAASMLISLSAEARDLSSYAKNLTFGVEYIDDWSDSTCCSGKSLKYTHNQMDYLQKVLRSYGAYRKFYYGNKDVYASDLTEDGLVNGSDDSYADTVQFYAFSGHGGTNYSDWYFIPMCGGSASCTFSSHDAVWGEEYGRYSPWNPYDSNPSSNPDLERNVTNKQAIAENPGSLRWVMLATCLAFSNDTYKTWASAALGTRLEFLMGYKGLSADSSYTDEVPEDWAENVYEDGMTFKAGWFDAAEDWWINDTAGAAAFGSTAAEAEHRLDNQTVIYKKRVSDNRGIYFSRAFHVG